MTANNHSCENKKCAGFSAFSYVFNTFVILCNKTRGRLKCDAATFAAVETNVFQLLLLFTQESVSRVNIWFAHILHYLPTKCLHLWLYTYWSLCLYVTYFDL